MHRLIIIAGIFSLILGCAAPPATTERLDPLTSVTLSFSETPMILYRDDPGRAAHARNYVSFGPLLANRSGDYQYFLWLGIWNTNQSPDLDERREGFDTIALFVDGEPLVLELAGWTPASIGASEPVYVPPVASALDAYYPITVDQIRLIAYSSDIQLRTTGFASRNFEMWDSQDVARDSFQRFLTLYR
jgi:hypothetical protein